MDKDGKYMGLRHLGQMTIETRRFKDDNGNYYEISIGSVGNLRDHGTIFHACGVAIDYLSRPERGALCRNLTDEEFEIYDQWIQAESKKTGETLF